GLRHDLAYRPALVPAFGGPNWPVWLSAHCRPNPEGTPQRQSAYADLHGARHPRPGRTPATRPRQLPNPGRHGLSGAMAYLPHAARSMPPRDPRYRGLYTPNYRRQAKPALTLTPFG